MSPLRLVLLLLAAPAAVFGQAHLLVENFTAPLPSNTQITSTVDLKTPKIGLGTGLFEYRLNASSHAAVLDLGNESRAIPGPGVLKVWVRGDASGNDLELGLRNAHPETMPDGRRSWSGTTNFSLPRVKLDFDGWKEISFDVPAVPAGDSAWWQRLTIYGSGRDAKAGVVALDDMRFFPASNPPPAVSLIGLMGGSAREFGGPVTAFLDLRNFSSAPAKVTARVTMTDRNENLVADREFQIDLAADASRETLLDLAPENLGAYLPPFKVTGDVLSSDLAALSARLDTTLVLGNSRYLFDDFSDVYGRWLTVGSPASPSDDFRSWQSWVQGEAQRATPLAQTTARISPADITPSADAPPGAVHALRLDYTGDAEVYDGGQRLLPGNAYRAGFWVKGDGSGSRLKVLFLDYTSGSDTNNQGWKRTNEGDRELAVLDFTGWRYIEVELPGRGIGANTPNGTSAAIDFPLELTAFHLEAAAGAKGTVLFGPVQVFTQQAQSGMLSVQIGYDDPWHRWQPALGSTVTVQNSSLTGPRKTRANWSLLDRAGEPVATGQAELALAAGEAKTFRIDLASRAADIAKRPAPFSLQVAAYDTADGSVSTTRQIILSKPDSRAIVADFEGDRGYLGLKAREVKNAPADGETAARTSTDQAHGGKRSLLIEWDRDNDFTRRFVSIDPALPGVPVDLSVWVYGDGSGVLFYPVIGDRKGINHGLVDGQWNLFLPRTADGPLQNAVRVDWTGWRELKFHLPPIAPNWAETMHSLGFVPNYPLGVHLAVDASGATKNAGRIYVDDLSVETHLVPASRVDLVFERTGESNIHAPGSPVQVIVANRDENASRRVLLSGGLFDWRGNRVAGVDQTLDLAAGARQPVTLAKDFPPGFYILRATLTDAAAAKPLVSLPLAAIEEDLLVADPVAVLGADWSKRITNEWELRKPVGERFSLVDEDWDWVEYHPGNLQLDTVRQRAGVVAAAGSDPYMLVGFSAYWAAGPGFDDMKAGAFVRKLRDRGHAVNTFLVPARLDDWDNYVSELMRGANDAVGGWVVWDGPDGTGPMGFPAEKFVPFLKSADKWRRLYCPDKPLLIGGLSKDTAVGYVGELAKNGGLDLITGVNVRLDVGRLSPEDAGVVGYSHDLSSVLNPSGTAKPRSVLLTELDWAVEKGDSGLDAFDQAAYLARTALLLDGTGVRSALTIRNGDYVRLGFGLAYRRDLLIPPMSEKPLAYQLKPAWWAMARVRAWLGDSTPEAEVEVQDIVPGRTRSLVRKTKEGAVETILWRDDDPGRVSFAGTGLKVTAAEDLFGADVPVTDGWYAVGKIPCRFTLAESGEPAVLALGRVQVRDGAEALWPQRVLAAFTPATGSRQAYAQTGGEPATLAGRTATGTTLSPAGLAFAKGGSERFQVDVPAGASLVLRKRYLLDATGQKADVIVNGKPAGTWDLSRSEAELSGGLRDGIFVIDSARLAGQPRADIEIRYATAANTAGWRVFECRAGEFPLSAVGPLHADQNVGSPRFARNIVGAPLKVGTQAFANGIGVFARSLLEFPLNGQFRRFTSKAGVDAATDGRGSVVFEVYADGKKLWSSPTLSGLDAAKDIDLDVTGVNRLRLVVTDAGDGNKYDVAVWGDPVLKR